MKLQHVPIQESCKLCNFHTDRTIHALFWCDESQKKWKGTIFKPILKQARSMDIMDVFDWMKKELCRDDFEYFAMCSWAVWHDRMKALHSENQLLTGSGMSWCLSLLQEYKDADKAIKIGVAA